MRIVVPLPAQIAQAERVRDALIHLRTEGVEYTEGPTVQERLDAQEGIVLTLRFNQTYEQDIRQFMASRSKG